jgi:hypothetical protein
MRYYKVASFFQAELDNLIFDIHDLPDNLNKMGNGVFIPRINKEIAAGSLIYINSEEGLSALCACAVECSNDGLTDMQILARFLDSSVYGITLPSEKTIVETISDPTNIGIFDSLLLGQCIFGLDARISDQLVKNRLSPFFTFDNPQRQLNELQISINLNKSIAFFSYPPTKEGYNIRNLHIHSKVFNQINNPKRLQYIQKTFNAGKSIVIYCDYKYHINQLPRRLIVMLKKIIKNLLPYYVVRQYQRSKSPSLYTMKDFEKDFKTKSTILSDNRFSCEWKDRYPCLEDNTKNTGFEPHYTYHPAWARAYFSKNKTQ